MTMYATFTPAEDYDTVTIGMETENDDPCAPLLAPEHV
jgi:hypothetical protein